MYQPLNSSVKDSSVTEKILGSRGDFSMENRLFSLECFIVMVLEVIFLVINGLEGYWSICLVVFVVLIIEAYFYYYSRFKGLYRTNIVINGILAYVALAINYYFNSGINGPTISLFVFTFHLLVAATPKKFQPYWIAFHILTLAAIMLVELEMPGLIKYGYANQFERTVDVLSCYVVTLLFIYIVSKFRLRYYLNQNARMEESKFKLKAFFKSSTTCYILLNSRLEIAYYNDAAAQFIKKAQNKDLREGEKIKNFLHASSTSLFLQDFNTALKGVRKEGEQMVEYDALGAIWWQYSFAPVRNGDGKITGVAFMCSDITERKAQEEKIRQKNRSLVKIAHIQSHELRQPVSSILGLLGLIEDDGANAQEYLLYLNSAVKELDTRLNEIMAQTKTSFND